jgi:hypothetical protein
MLAVYLWGKGMGGEKGKRKNLPHSENERFPFHHFLEGGEITGGEGKIDDVHHSEMVVWKESTRNESENQTQSLLPLFPKVHKYATTENQ